VLIRLGVELERGRRVWLVEDLEREEDLGRRGVWEDPTLLAGVEVVVVWR